MNEWATHQRFRGPVQAVVFDWAGTTVDFGSRAPVLAVMEAFRRREVPITMEEARGPMGMAKRDHLCAVASLPRVRDRWQTVHGRPPTDDDVDQLYRQFVPLQKEVLAAHADLIPGCRETVEACRARDLRIGSSTGYTRELMDVLVPLARQQGFAPDAVVCADDVAAGRPAPWMNWENARRLNVYPPAAIVVVDDTIVGIEAGRNAGMWAVGVVRSGNLIGLSVEELDRLDRAAQTARYEAARQQLDSSGAHFVIDTVADLPALLDQIDHHLRSGDRP
jgi:phosphonoacetaldehyde hydrolase